MLPLWDPLQRLWTVPLADAAGQPRGRAVPTTSPPPRLLRGRAAVAAVVAASVATVGVIVVTLLADAAQPVSEIAAPPAAEAPAPQPAPPAPPQLATAPEPSSTPRRSPPAPPPYAMDNRGFVSSKARCDGDQRAVAMGRTDRSVIVVCRGANSRFTYKGVRLSDGAALVLSNVRKVPQGYEARGEAAIYRVSPRELVAIWDGEILRRDPMIDYRTS